MRPPLYTEGNHRFYEALGFFACGAAFTFALLAFVKVGKEYCEDTDHTGVRETGDLVGEGGQGDSIAGNGGADSEVPEGLPTEDFAQHCRINPPEEFNAFIGKAAEAHKVNPRVIALTVYRESRCKTDALGAAGEIGLGQIHPVVWETTLKREGIINSVDDLYDPEVNLHAVGFVLSEALRYAKGDPKDALRRYNGSGPAAQRYATEQYLVYRDFWGETPWF